MSILSPLEEERLWARPSRQVQILEADDRHKPFVRSLVEAGLYPLKAVGVESLQLNLGKRCNQSCTHCHVDAGPERGEAMPHDTMRACLDALAGSDIPLVDLTGGAPEMNPHFRWLVEQARLLGRRVIDRCNLTILSEPGYDDLSDFLAENRVEVIASLPCYLEETVDRQRGQGAFGRSLEGLRRLNRVGYGQPESGLRLTLVHNPRGTGLPPNQKELEKTYRRELKSRHGVLFNRLTTMTNMPISRFLFSLMRNGQYDEYMGSLIDAFNPAAAAGVMCRTTLSVDWTGRLFDCDFNQALELDLEPRAPRHIRDFDLRKLASRRITCGQHCHGCTAGAGSSCQGAILPA